MDYLLPLRSVVVNGQQLDSFKDIAGHEQELFNNTILNAGGFVTSVAWAPGYEGYEQYLAVGVLDDKHRDPMESEVNSLDTSLFSRKGFASSIYIYRVNLNPQSGDQSVCSLVSSFSHDFGSVVSLKWRPGGAKGESVVGLLAMINHDGFLRVLQVPRDLVLKRCEYCVFRISKPLTF